jgi:hypothetical protein
MIEQPNDMSAPKTHALKAAADSGPVPGVVVSIPGTKTALLGALGAFLASLGTSAGIDALARLISALRGCAP